MKTILGLLISLASYDVALGAWASGGGELIKDQSNPWFLKNTSEVTYCIEKDDRYFDQSVETLDQMIQLAVGYWQDQFSRALKNEIVVGTQTFRQVLCAEDPILRFQFGTLSPSQRINLLPLDPLEFVAFLIRTDYDDVNLRGKGFLYVSPDSGPNRYRGDQYADNAWHWGEGGALHKVLIHELGHLFGLRHDHDVMAADFPDSMVRPETGAPDHPMQKLSFDQDYFQFNPSRDWIGCPTGPMREAPQAFFPLPSDFRCIRVAFEAENVPVKGADVSYQRAGSDEWIPAGKFVRDGYEEDYPSNQIMVYVTPNQRVFSSSGFGYLPGTATRNWQLFGRFYAAGTTTGIQAILQLKPNRFYMRGLLTETYGTVFYGMPVADEAQN